MFLLLLAINCNLVRSSHPRKWRANGTIDAERQQLAELMIIEMHMLGGVSWVGEDQQSVGAA